MNEKERKSLSINPEVSEIDLGVNSADNSAAMLRSLLGPVPIVGSLLQEAVNVVIPNQRIERVVLMVEILGEKLKDVEAEVLRQKILSEEFTDLLEDAIPQAARSLSDERRDYIASLLAKSLTCEELDHIHEKKLLSILGELNDAEILFLRHESLRQPEKNVFFERHKGVLTPVAAAIGSPRSEHDKRAFRNSFRNKLLDLGLMQNDYVSTAKGTLPEMDEKTGTLKVRSSKLTQLGHVFLRYIGQPSTKDRQEDEFYATKQKMTG